MENTQKPIQSEEVDLGQLFVKLGQFFKNTGLALISFLAVIRKVPLENKMVFAIVTASSIGVTTFYGTSLKRSFYESTMILSSNYLNKRIIDNSIEKLNLLAEEKNKTGLAKVLQIPDTVAENIVKFEARPFVSESDLIELEVLKEQLKAAQETSKNPKVIDQVIKRIEIENRHAFEITVRTFNPTVVIDLQNSLVEYFRGNSYVRKRIETNEVLMNERRAKLDQQSKKLDSLKGVIYANFKAMSEQGRQGSNNVILSDHAVTDPVEVYSQDLEIYREIQNIDYQLKVKPDFEVVDGFTEFSEPASASLPKMIAQAFLIGIGLAYLIIALKQFNAYLAKFS